MLKIKGLQINGENIIIAASDFDKLIKMAEQVEDWTRCSESCESKLDQLGANELVVELRQEIERLTKVLQKPDCATCINLGEVNELSQETYCKNCIHNKLGRRDHYVRR